MPCPPGSRRPTVGAPEVLCRYSQVRSSSSRGITWSASPCATNTGRCASRAGRPAPRRRTAGCRRGWRHPRSDRVGQHEPAGERRSPTEPDEHDRPTGGRDGIQPGPEPPHRGVERLGHRATDAAVGEPRVATALGDRRPDRRVRHSRRQVRCERQDLLLVRAAAVEQHDEGRGGVVGAVRRDDRITEGGVRGSWCASSLFDRLAGRSVRRGQVRRRGRSRRSRRPSRRRRG